MPTDRRPGPAFGPTTHRLDCPPSRPICGPDLPTALYHRARRPSARCPPARPADPPPDPAAVGSGDQGPGHPVGPVGRSGVSRSGGQAVGRGNRDAGPDDPTEPAPDPGSGSGSGSGLTIPPAPALGSSIHRLRLRLWLCTTGPTIPTAHRSAPAHHPDGPPSRRPTDQHRPTIPTVHHPDGPPISTGPPSRRPTDQHRPTIPTVHHPDGPPISTGPPSRRRAIPTAHRPVGGHEILPSGGHVAARWRPTVLPSGGQRSCPR